ncbi:MAG: SNF2 helicase associated domain-containing protein, partial [Defluviitaleaceae bacterium]|nr:SNF2 helicase associated domain-containing protein [Defluviitaleaceae bacterium]
MSFNLKNGQILALATDENVFRRGEKYYNEGNVADISVVEQDNPPGEVVLAKVTGSRSSSYNVRLAFRTNGTLESYRCNCDAAAIWKGACKHSVAVMLGIANRQAESFNKAFADRVKTSMVDHFKGKLISKIDSEFASLQSAEHRKASLIPTLYVEGKQDYSLGFSVGFSRQYVVRNIKNFVLQVQNGAVVKYGKGLEFRHDIAVFDEHSSRLIDALIKFYGSVRELEKLGGGAFRMVGAGEETRFAMPAWFSDIFFDIYGETGFLVNAPVFKKLEFVAVQRDTGSIAGFNIVDEQTKISVSPLTSSFVVIDGESADYFLTPDGFCKLGKAAAADFIALSSNISRLNLEEFALEGVHAADFRTYVMPQLARSGLLAGSAAAANEPSVQTAEMLQKLCFYLDAPGKGERVTCRVELESSNGEKADMFLPEEQAESYEHLWVRAFLQHYGFEEDSIAGYYMLSSDDQIYNFYLTGVQTAVKMGQVFATDAFENRKVMRPQKPSAHVRIHGGLLEVELELDGYSLKELADAISSYRLSKKYHRLRSGRFINLEDENVRAVVQLLDGADASKKGYEPNKIVTPLYRALEMGEEIRALSGINAVCDDAVNRLISDLQNYDADAVAFEVPASLENIVRSYQKTGFRWLKTLTSYSFGGILADEMGLGKTLQMISLLLSHKQEHSMMKALVVAPTSLIYNWESEIYKFAPSLNAVVVAGNPQRRKELLSEAVADGGADVIITTYDMLKRDIDSYSEFDFDYIIADEAQYMKNPATQNSAAVKAVNGRVR